MVSSPTRAMSLPSVSSEGGPIILGDFEALRVWRGISGSSSHYDTACEFVERSNPSPISLSGADCLVWDFGGPGTGNIVVVSDKHISVIRIWPDASWTESETDSVVISSATARFGEAIIAHLTISSGYLLGLWATEDASEFSPPCGDQGFPDPGLSTGSGGAYVRIPCGRYEITTCEWEEDKFNITKLDLHKTEPVGTSIN